jgi:hypothetical protein
MAVQKNVATSAGGARDEPNTMSNVETQSQCKALAKTTGNRCKKIASPGSEYCHVHQRMAGKQSQHENTERALFGQEAANAPENPRTHRKKEWMQHAGFYLFFDYRIDEHGKQVMDEHGRQIWQTRVYDIKSGAEEPLSGIDTAPWVNWVLERAKLPGLTEPISTEIEEAVRPAPMAAHDARIDILEVRLLPLGPSFNVPEKRLRAEVDFRVSGTEAVTMAPEQVSFWTQFHTVDLESGAVNPVAAEQSQLQSEVSKYTSKQSFPIPDLGRYEVHCIVLLIPPIGRIAFHQGPTFEVVP